MNTNLYFHAKFVNIFNIKQCSCLLSQICLRKRTFQETTRKEHSVKLPLLHDRSLCTYRCERADSYFDKGFKAFVFGHEVFVDVDSFIVTAAESPINLLHFFTFRSRELEQDVTDLNTQN